MARKSAARHRARTLLRKRSWGLIGIDISIASISGAILSYDRVLDRTFGPDIFSVRFMSDTDFIKRLGVASNAQNFIQSLSARTTIRVLDLDETYIAVEEAWPAGIVRKAESGWLRQQAQMQGAFMGGLSRWGYRNIYEVNAQSWRGVVAKDLGVKVNKDFTKWTVKDWALERYDVPDLPDLIKRKGGLVPKPDESRAKPVQPEDVYDALGILRWLELQNPTDVV